MHRQPTPESIAAAKANLGDVSAESIKAAEAFMTRAPDADRTGDQSACERALAEASWSRQRRARVLAACNSQNLAL
jgi:hypothetical protein